MHKQVIVINITDTTDRDSLITAQASSEYKSRLLSSVSHELRTPLNGSINFIEQTLNDRSIPTQAKEKWLIPALRSNRLLLSLVNDILDFSQMHAGKLRLVFEPRNIVETVKECIELLEIQAKKKSLKLSLKNNLDMESEVVTTDHNRLRQVILNLLSNAVKFTFKGGVKVILDPLTAKRDPLSLNGQHEALKGVRITCRDTGIGISRENQKRLFQAFEKIDLGNRAAINATGAGLGLLISNNLVQRLSPEDVEFGESKMIRFESKEEVGTNFYFDIWNRVQERVDSRHTELDGYKSSESLGGASEGGIEIRSIEELNRMISFCSSHQGLKRRGSTEIPYSKMKRSMTHNQMSQTSTASQISCKCPKILIVDDDPFNLTALEQILNKLRIDCHWAFNGREAIEKIEYRQLNRCCSGCSQYKVIFLDCSMPILDGFETTKILRQMIKKGEVDDLKIIACTALVQQSDEDKAKVVGMDDFCTKPIKIGAIKEKLLLVGYYG